MGARFTCELLLFIESTDVETGDWEGQQMSVLSTLPPSDTASFGPQPHTA